MPVDMKHTVMSSTQCNPFVRSLYEEEEVPIKELPFSFTQFGAVLMVDIVGFSQMTSIASSKGDVGAEMLASQIGAYFDLAIRIIEFHGGDVVKFLGDALLVVFQQDPTPARVHGSDPSSSPLLQEENPAATLKRNKIIVRKAVECGLELLARLSNYRIYLSEREYSRKLSASSLGVEDGVSSEDSSTSVAGSAGNRLSDSRRSSLNALGGANGAHPSTIKIGNMTTGSAFGGGHLGTSEFPMGFGVTSGITAPSLVPVLNIVPPGQNNNSSGYVSDQSHIGPGGIAGFKKREGSVVSSTKGSSTGSNKNRNGSFLSNAKNLFTHANSSDQQSSGLPSEVMPITEGFAAPDDSHDLQLHMALSAGDITNIIIGDEGDNDAFNNLLTQETGRLEYAICGEHMSSIDDALNMARAGEVTITKRAWKYVNPDSYPWSEPRRNCFILKNNQPPETVEAPLLRKVRNDRLLNTGGDVNPNYFKYINKSAIHRLILYPDSNFPAQFRNVTILFISLGDVKPWSPEGLAFCQKAMIIVHQVTSAYEGFIQQFAVDDKGATLLCAFGLPYPRSHEKEAVFAAKSAWMIRQEFLAQGIHGFKISLATGVIFTSMIGNEFRRDPAIVGDTIVIAVRILKFDYATDSIVLDDATRVACTTDSDELCEFEDRGEEFVKGKTHPLRIWKLVHFGAKKQTRRPEDVGVDETIGYDPEREKIVNHVTTWAKTPDHHTILVTGPRGSGKSMFYHQMIHMADNFGYRICSAASAEVEKNTEYYPVKFLLLGLFDIIRQRDIPYSSKSTNTSVPSPLTADGVEESEILPNPVTIVTCPATSATEEEPPLPPATIGSPGMLQPKSGIMQATDTSTTVSSTHLDRRRASNFSVDLDDSPTISQYGEPSARRSASMTKLEAYIIVCLAKIGEMDSKLLPKLNKIISAMSCDNATPLVEERDDDILADFIVDILNYASRFVKIIVMFEDVQWCDKKSLNIYRIIHERCPKVLVVLFSRPQRDYGGNIAIQAFTNHPHHLEIALEGLKRREIELALIKAFKTSGVTRVSPEVLELVQQRTKGNPKFVKNMATMLMDFCHVSIVDGELLSTGQEANPDPSSKVVEEMVMKQDRKRTTLMQYDRLRPRFQDFVKIASCLGDRFSLAEIAAIRPLENLLGTPEPGKSYANVISDQDTYRFLSMATDQQTNIQFSNSVVLQTIYTFGSSSTAGYIYDSIPYEERVGYHLKMGQFYESFLEQGYIEDLTELPLNGQDLLPQITRHYMKTEHTEKKIKYLKALSSFDLKSNMLTDTTQNINDLIFILDTVPGAREMISQEDLADIYRIKGESLSKRMRIEEAEPALMESLAYYGIAWPQTKQQWKTELLREGLKFKFHHIRGATPVQPPKHGQREPKAKVAGKEKVRYQRIIRVMYCLQNIYFWLTHPSAAMLSCLYTLKYCRKLGLPSGIQTASLGRMGLLYYFQNKKRLCEKYMNDSWALDKDGQSSEGMLPAMAAYVEYSEGRLEEAHRLLVESIQESKTFGVVTHLASFYRAVIMKSAYRMWEGAYNNHPEDCQLLRTLSAVAIQNGDSEGETLFAIPTLSNLLLQDRLREAESWVVLIERFIMPKARLMNLLIGHSILGYYYARIGQYEKSRLYLELFGDVIEIPAGGAHPFPVMSCMFSLMSLYEMLENGRSIEKDAACPSTFLQTRAPTIIKHILIYLKNEPASPIPKSYTCLGEGLMCLLTPGREKEGAQRLIQGYKELRGHLDGLHFVKAYFLARVGRYCPDPAQKEVYYREAHELFSKMSMDSSFWLSDPNSPWIPPARAAAGGPDENRRSFIRSDMPTATHSAPMEMGTLGWVVAEAKAHPEVLQRPFNRNGSGGIDPPPGMDTNQSGAIRGEGWGVNATDQASSIPSPPAVAAPSDSAIAPWANENGAGAEGKATEGAGPEPEPKMNFESHLTLTASSTGAVLKVPKCRSYVALDEGLFDYELATAARVTCPTVQNMNGGGTGVAVNLTEVEFNGQATQGQVM
ncbi:hypothetical protein EC957_005957 [Mortierella hygrophila]|uniref:Guanylate cyclase domain-containing protein n=1 Tax=Mortierella hygrophila TaxID=979708 RepID=A0A9P6F063_9FUNG|nr:hypothetical protein EC957_005957 [Mortierella hygrophila]